MLPADPTLGNLVAFHLMIELMISIQKSQAQSGCKGWLQLTIFCSATFLNVDFFYNTTGKIPQQVFAQTRNTIALAVSKHW